MKNDLICYSTDGSGIKGKFDDVVFPRNVDEVKSIVMRYQDIIPRGFGTNIVGGCVPKDSVVIDMKKMNMINFDKKNKIVIVGPGVSVKELNERLKVIGYEFPIYSGGSIGGMIAINTIGLLGGYGRIKDWIEEVKFVNGRGDIVKVGKADLGDVCGMEGITGVITNIKLKVIPLRKNSLSVFQSGLIEEVFSIVKRLKIDKDVVMIRLYSPHTSKLMGFPSRYHIIVMFNSERGKIKGSVYWDLMGRIGKDFIYLFADGYSGCEDPMFFFDKVKNFVLYLDEMGVPYISDLSSSIVYPFFKFDIKKDDVNNLIKRMNGLPGKFGIGLKRKDRIDELQKKIFKRIKLRHDPFGKMNKGKVIDFVGVGGEDVSNQPSILDRSPISPLTLPPSLDGMGEQSRPPSRPQKSESEIASRSNKIDYEIKKPVFQMNDKEDCAEKQMNEFIEETEKEEVGVVDVEDELDREVDDEARGA